MNARRRSQRIGFPQAWIVLFCVSALTSLAVGCQPGGALVTLEWSTASEVDNAGFNLYRSLTIDGPFSRINETVIPAKSQTVTGGRYSYADRQVNEGTTYWYRLEDIGLDGKITVHQPLEVKAQGGSFLGSSLWIVVGLAVIAWLWIVNSGPVEKIKKWLTKT